MKINSIKKKVKEIGTWAAVEYYLCRIATKLSMIVIGKYTQYFSEVCENRIIFKNRQQQDYSDNARALFEYLVENNYNEKYEIIWAVSDPDNFRKMSYRNVKFVTAENKLGWTSPKAFYYGNTAKYFFYTNNTADLNRYHCKGQLTVNLWHGCGYKGGIRNKMEIPRSSTMEMFDYALVPGPVFVETKSKYWNRSKDAILPLGYPRYDWMLDKSNDKQLILGKLFGWHVVNEKVVIWMPTFRKSCLDGYAENKIELPFDLPGLQEDSELKDLDLFCKQENILLIVKKHPLQNMWKQQEDLKNIYYITDEILQKKKILLYQLVGISDGLISDYSSIAVDYLLMDRPIGFVLADYKDYTDTRGFVFENPLAYMPGPKLYCLDDIEKFLCQISNGEDAWRKKRHELMPQMHNKTENYRERIINTIFSISTSER